MRVVEADYLHDLAWVGFHGQAAGCRARVY
jgi:hypothetical protein